MIFLPKLAVLLPALLTTTAAQIVFPGGSINRGSNGNNNGGGGIVIDFGDGGNNGNLVIGGNGQCSSGECTPLVLCSMEYEDLSSLTACTLSQGGGGVCCSEQAFSVAAEAAPGEEGIGDRALFQQPQRDVPIRTLAPNELNVASRDAMAVVFQQDIIESNLLQQGVVVRPGTPEFGHLLFFQTTREAQRLARNALIAIETTQMLQQQNNFNAEESGVGLQQFSISNTILDSTCPPIPQCKRSKYRTADGSCNNLRNPQWGQSRTAMQRILEPRYSDGVWEPRVAIDGGELPSARLVSESFTGSSDNDHPDITLSVMQWGQFIDHDLTHSPIFRFDNHTGIQCCENGDIVSPDRRHPQCFPISIPQDDSFFSRHGQRCMNFVRSMPASRPNCTLGYAEQMNQLTHHLDGSNIYGSDEAQTEQLRTFSGGKLRTSGFNLLPLDPEIEPGECFSQNPCFKAGDSRVNEQPSLTAIHTIWLREHNRVAEELSRFNPGWRDETLFQETRRIVVAEMQHIIYNEFLPVVLGRRYMRAFNILPRFFGFSRDYNEFINPSTTNEFATAAFRFGHSLVQGLIRLFSNPRFSDGSVKLQDAFNNPDLVFSGNLDALLRGLATQRSQRVDVFFAGDLTEQLFKPPGGGFGMDLISLNIQRGRDHGIPGYNELREVCGLRRARTFNDFTDVISPRTVQTLSRLYRHVDDVDLFVGGIAERSLSRALLGPTFLCIVGDQFARLKKGDRFFYDLGGQLHSFTESQLQQIRRTSWARLICDNSDNIQVMQPLALRLPNRGFFNRQYPCNSFAIPRVNLSPWINERTF